MSQHGFGDPGTVFNYFSANPHRQARRCGSLATGCVTSRQWIATLLFVIEPTRRWARQQAGLCAECASIQALREMRVVDNDSGRNGSRQPKSWKPLHCWYKLRNSA